MLQGQVVGNSTHSLSVATRCEDDAMTVLGAVFLPGFAPERLYDVVRAADVAGMDELWLWEDCFSESRIASAALDPVPAPNPRPSHQSSAARGSIATQNCTGGVKSLRAWSAAASASAALPGKGRHSQPPAQYRFVQYGPVSSCRSHLRAGGR
jgi:hypothetical protein